MRHGDANDFGSAAGYAPLFDDGPFVQSQMEPTNEERMVGSIIWKHRGRGNPVSIARLQELTGYDPRKIKGVVEQLVVAHKLRIGGRREEPMGYFLIEDADDQECAVRPYKSQILAMLRRLRVLEGRQQINEWLGQLKIED